MPGGALYTGRGSRMRSHGRSSGGQRGTSCLKRAGGGRSASPGLKVDLEGGGAVVGGFPELLKVGTAKDLEEGSLVGIYPLDGGETTGGGVEPLWELLLVDEGDEAGEETLDEVEDVADGLDDETLGCEHVAVEDHLPLNAPLWGEEGGGVHGELEFQGWAEGEASRGAPGGGCLDGEEHAGVGGLGVLPAVVLYEEGLEGEEVLVRAGVGGAERLCGGEGDAGAAGPAVHVADVAGEVDLGSGGGGRLHGGPAAGAGHAIYSSPVIRPRGRDRPGRGCGTAAISTRAGRATCFDDKPSLLFPAIFTHFDTQSRLIGSRSAQIPLDNDHHVRHLAHIPGRPRRRAGPSPAPPPSPAHPPSSPSPSPPSSPSPSSSPAPMVPPPTHPSSPPRLTLPQPTPCSSSSRRSTTAPGCSASAPPTPSASTPAASSSSRSSPSSPTTPM